MDQETDSVGAGPRGPGRTVFRRGSGVAEFSPMPVPMEWQRSRPPALAQAVPFHEGAVTKLAVTFRLVARSSHVQ